MDTGYRKPVSLVDVAFFDDGLQVIERPETVESVVPASNHEGQELAERHRAQ